LYEGANSNLKLDSIRQYENIIKDAKTLLIQNEIPFESVHWALQYARENGVTTVYNPAPAYPIDEGLWRFIDVTITNETECKIILGYETDADISYENLINELLSKGIRIPIITMGSRGVIFHDGSSIKWQEANKVRVVDTTGAGDAFIGGFVYGLSKEMPVAESVKIGNIVASIKISNAGAQNYNLDAGFWKEYLAW